MSRTPPSGSIQDHFPVIWRVVGAIPRGRVASYGQVADMAELPGRARWVARALKTCPDPSLPWHRVVRADGQLGLPADSSEGQEQVARLRAEGVVVSGGRIAMRHYRWRPSWEDLIYGPGSGQDMP
jgi:methylated-DNA-protein-cysteine methyltransferase-like protein